MMFPFGLEISPCTTIKYVNVGNVKYLQGPLSGLSRLGLNRICKWTLYHTATTKQPTDQWPTPCSNSAKALAVVNYVAYEASEGTLSVGQAWHGCLSVLDFGLFWIPWILDWWYILRIPKNWSIKQQSQDLRFLQMLWNFCPFVEPIGRSSCACSLQPRSPSPGGSDLSSPPSSQLIENNRRQGGKKWTQ